MKAFTLAEILIAVALMAFAILGIVNVSVFYSVQARSLMDLADCQAQLNLAAEDIKLHLMSAERVDANSVFSPSSGMPSGGDAARFQVTGERNIYDITPNDLENAVDYLYMINDDGALIRRTTDGGVEADEVLVDARYAPVINFRYRGTDEMQALVPPQPSDPPNFMIVTITGHTRTRSLGMLDNRVVRMLGVRFWFIDVVR